MPAQGSGDPRGGPANADRAEEGILAQIARLRSERLAPEELARELAENADAALSAKGQ